MRIRREEPDKVLEKTEKVIKYLNTKQAEELRAQPGKCAVVIAGIRRTEEEISGFQKEELFSPAKVGSTKNKG